MKPLDPDHESLLREWIEKADADLEAAEKLAPSVAASIRLREIVGFHCQQTVAPRRVSFFQMDCYPRSHREYSDGMKQLAIDQVAERGIESPGLPAVTRGDLGGVSWKLWVVDEIGSHS